MCRGRSGIGVDIDRAAEQMHVAILALTAAARDAHDEGGFACEQAIE